jgi:hypothetical protein
VNHSCVTFSSPDMNTVWPTLWLYSLTLSNYSTMWACSWHLDSLKLEDGTYVFYQNIRSKLQTMPHIPEYFYFKQVWCMPHASGFLKSFHSLICMFCQYDCSVFFTLVHLKRDRWKNHVNSWIY